MCVRSSVSQFSGVRAASSLIQIVPGITFLDLGLLSSWLPVEEFPLARLAVHSEKTRKENPHRAVNRTVYRRFGGRR